MYKNQSPGTAKQGQVKLVAHIGAKYIALRVLKLLAFFAIAHAVGTVLFWTPLIGLLLAVLSGALGWVVALGGIGTMMMYRMSGVTVTADGIYGRDSRGKKFDLCYDQIQHFEQHGNRIDVGADVITARGNVRKREYVLHVTNADEIMQAYDNR